MFKIHHYHVQIYMEKQLLWDKMKWWKVYCLRGQINVVCILAALHSPEAGGNMAGAKTARAEVWLFSNICVCVGGVGRVVLQAGCVKSGASTYFFCLSFGLFSPTLFYQS